MRSLPYGRWWAVMHSWSYEMVGSAWMSLYDACVRRYMCVSRMVCIGDA